MQSFRALYLLAQYQIYIVNHKKRDILFLTITLTNLNRFLYFYIINTFRLETSLFFVYLCSQQKRTEKLISNYQVYSVTIF